MAKLILKSSEVSEFVKTHIHNGAVLDMAMRDNPKHAAKIQTLVDEADREERFETVWRLTQALTAESDSTDFWAIISYGKNARERSDIATEVHEAASKARIRAKLQELKEKYNVLTMEESSIGINFYNADMDKIAQIDYENRGDYLPELTIQLQRCNNQSDIDRHINTLAFIGAVYEEFVFFTKDIIEIAAQCYTEKMATIGKTQ